MNSYIKIYGEPPFSLIYMKKNTPVGIDLVLIRPDPLLYLKKHQTYEAKIYLKKNKLYKFMIGEKIYEVV